ncbi:MAG: S4 domain-containing protein [Candidatus Eisenbacteria bacterium]|nr:S4 domain-containing protein [Candidatus Eisenbacteria bacterium]
MGRRHKEESLHRDKNLAVGKERIDKYLHWSCLFESRSLVSRASRKGQIVVNGSPVRASKIVTLGDKVAFKKGSAQLTIEIVKLPGKQASVKEARGFYKILERTSETE